LLLFSPSHSLSLYLYLAILIARAVVALSLEQLPPGTHHWVDAQIGPLTYARSRHRFYERGWGSVRDLCS
jgi:hypothetical protein